MLAPVGGFDTPQLPDADHHLALHRQRRLTDYAIAILQIAGQPGPIAGNQLLFATADHPVAVREVDLVDDLVLQEYSPVADIADAAPAHQQGAGRQARIGAIVTDGAHDADRFAKGKSGSHGVFSSNCC